MKDGTGKIVFVNLSGFLDGLSLDSTKSIRILPLIMKYAIERNYFSINAYDTTSKLESEEQTIQGQNEKEIMAEDIIKLPGDISEEAKKSGVGVQWQFQLYSICSDNQHCSYRKLDCKEEVSHVKQ